MCVIMIITLQYFLFPCYSLIFREKSQKIGVGLTDFQFLIIFNKAKKSVLWFIRLKARTDIVKLKLSIYGTKN